MNNNKWYSRLAKVIIWVLTLGSLVFSIFTIYDNRETKYSFSFESDYESYNKKDTSFFNSPKVFNDGAYRGFSGSNEVGRYRKGRLIERYMENYPNNMIYDYKSLGNEIIELKKQGVENYVIFDKLIEKDAEKINSIKFKMWESVSMIYFLWLILPVLVYFGLAYFYKKIILYIVFGDKN